MTAIGEKKAEPTPIAASTNETKTSNINTIEIARCATIRPRIKARLDSASSAAQESGFHGSRPRFLHASTSATQAIESRKK